MGKREYGEMQGQVKLLRMMLATAVPLWIDRLKIDRGRKSRPGRKECGQTITEGGVEFLGLKFEARPGEGGPVEA